MKSQTCCFTGHRKLPPEEVPAIQERLRGVLRDAIAQGYRYFHAGGALGFDTLAAQEVLRLRETYPEIRLNLILPCPTQTKFWKKEDVETYERIKAAADTVLYVSPAYDSGCMHRRNRCLVDASSLCVCYLTRPSGGTAYTVRYAAKQGLKTVNLAEK